MIRSSVSLALFCCLATLVARGQQAQDPAPAVPSSAPATVSDDYRIGAGDVLEVMVWKEPEASVPSVAVRADGKAGLPLIKDVDLAGLTPTQAESIITSRLKPFINEPDVTVIVREVHSKRIYVVGAVRREGPLDLKYPMTILQALLESGGPTDYAKKKRIYILREENGKQIRIDFNYDAAIRGEQLQQNVQVMPGDTLVVPD